MPMPSRLKQKKTYFHLQNFNQFTKYIDNSFVVSPLLIFAFFTIVCCSCNRESSETELTYTATFIDEKLDFKKFRVFVLNTTNYDEIVPTGNFKILDSIIQLCKYLDKV